MKKFIPWVLAAVLLLTGCGHTAEKYHIEGATWQIATVQSAEDGSILAVGESMQQGYPDATLLALTCTAQNGKLLFSMEEQTWEGSYTLQKSDDAAAIYTITVGDESGPAAVSATTYQNGAAEQTLVLQLGGYSLYFTASAS